VFALAASNVPTIATAAMSVPFTKAQWANIEL
jgi:hypothetical protein